MQSTMKRMLDDLARPRVLVDGWHPAPPGWWYLTLTAVAAPILLPPPSSPGLKGCDFFFSRPPPASGHPRCLLHLGYFSTEEDARKWRVVLGRVYPHALVARIAATQSEVAAAAAGMDVSRAVTPRAELTDAQVMTMLEDYGTARTGTQQSTAAVQPAPAQPANAQKASKRRSVSLEDTLNELRDSTLNLEPDLEPDPLSSTGVRHLRIEVSKSRAPQPRRAKGTRSS